MQAIIATRNLTKLSPVPPRLFVKPPGLSFCLAWLALAACAHAQPIKLLTQPQDPYGFPRPGAGQKDVPLRTSLFLELGMGPNATDTVSPNSVAVSLQPAGGAVLDVIKPGRKFAAGYSGKLFAATFGWQGEQALAIYATPEAPLKPSTTYTIRVTAKSRKGAELPPKDATWTFTTEAAAGQEKLSLTLDLTRPPVQWHGGFFTGFCKPSFCTSDPTLIATYDLMAEARRQYPNAWSLQRDFWMTGMDDKPAILAPTLPNIVRERETRRIIAIENLENATRLKVEDFFGHEQYGIPADRPLSADYHPGDEVLIADGTHDARAKVVNTDDQAGTVLVSWAEKGSGSFRAQHPSGRSGEMNLTPFPPPSGWALKYAAKPPTREDPHTPGLFALGGCYLRKFKPCGTPCYYWGRLDKEWDLAHRRYHRRLMPNFADAPGDLSIDGRNWTTAKDYAELHEVVRAITDHLIERYGDASLTFTWSVFNEPDLGVLFWRSDWDELQRFYDYTTDAILRAFEDRGYDSHKVFIGGLELGGIFGTNLKLTEFLAHCSPRARAKGALPANAAFADARLDGKRSKRVEELCRANAGKGAPCDFVSIHSYNCSELMAAKLAKAKEMALQIDPEYYAGLWVDSHECCPNWSPPPDPAAADSYLGNGYYPTWCADVVARQLRQAAIDPRYAFGQTILTFWQFPNRNFQGLQNATRAINVDDNGDGRTDREVLVPTPVFHFLNLLSTMGESYWPVPQQVSGGHVIGGFASRPDGTPSRTASFGSLADSAASRPGGLASRTAGFGSLADSATSRPDGIASHADAPTSRPDAIASRPGAAASRPDSELRVVLYAHNALDTQSRSDQTFKVALDISGLPWPRVQVKEYRFDRDHNTYYRLGRQLRDRPGAGWFLNECYTPEEVRQVQDLSALRPTDLGAHNPDPTGRLQLSLDLTANSAAFLVISPAP